MIVAAAEDGAIGRGGDLIWRISADLKRFKAITMGHTIIMGRKTWDSLPKGALPGRRNVVVTRDETFAAVGADVYHSLEEAIASCNGQEAFIIGGAQIYALALDIADRFYLTRVEQEYEGDTSFPAWDESAWRRLSREEHERGEKYPYPFAFELYVRIEK